MTLIDLPAAIRTHLLAEAAVVALTGTRIYAEEDTPPAGYKPGTDGTALCFRVRGGGPDFPDARLMPSVLFRCYAANKPDAQELYRALYAALHGHCGATVRYGQIDMLGETLTDPDTGFPFVLCAFRLAVVAESS